jgi:PAS domain S-box-containing protein
MVTVPVPLKVLLVEDDPGEARRIGALLQQGGAVPIELRHVGRLGQAMQHIRENGFHAIVLDLSLPDSDGLETFTRVYSQAPHAPIFVLTAQQDEEVGMRAVREGAQDYLSKSEVSGPVLYHAIRFGIERHRAEAAVRASEAQLRAIIDAAPDAVIMLDEEGVVHRWNLQAERLLGWPAAEAIGCTFADTMLPVRHRNTWERSLARITRTVDRSDDYRLEMEVIRPDGREIPLALMVALVPAAGTSVFSVFARPSTVRRGLQAGTLEITPRQREVLRLIAEGCSTRETARRLGVSVKTIEAHRVQVMKRLGTKSVAGLVRYAARVGLIELEP